MISHITLKLKKESLFMRGVFKRIAIAAVATVALLSTGFGIVTAQTTTGAGNGFRISPVRSELTIEKGKSQTLTITIENPTDSNVTATPIVNDFISSDRENGEPRLILDDTSPSPKNSFKTLVESISSVPLGPREKKDINVTIRVPQDANAGGYYGAVRFAPGTTTGSGNVGLTASVGTIVLITVPGDLKEKIDLVQLSAAQNGSLKSFFTGGEVSIVTRIKNDGDIHVKPFGKIVIKNMFGKTVKEYEVNNIDPRANVLPDSIRRFEDAIAKPGKGWFGRYTVTAHIAPSQGSGQIINGQATFWYLPPWAIITFVALILVILGGGYLLVRKFTGGSHRRKK